MKLTAIALTASVLFASALRLSAGPLGVGSDFDVIVKNDLTVNNAHIHGTSAVGHDLRLNGNTSEFGNNMGANSGPALVIGNNVILNADGRVNGSRFVQINQLTNGQSKTSQGITGGGKKLEASTVSVGSVALDIANTFASFGLLSQAMSALPSTVTLAAVTSGDALNKQLNLNFAAGTGYQVLNLTLAEFLSIKNIQVGAAAANTRSWIINVDLTGYDESTITQNRNGNDSGADQIIWNFYGASTLTLANQFYGTIFAPDVVVTHLNNDIKGQVIASSFIKTDGQVHVHRYKGDVPKKHYVPDSASTLGLVIGAFAGLMLLRTRRA
jgi:choice-of-anchor A domain-containing protein